MASSQQLKIIQSNLTNGFNWRPVSDKLHMKHELEQNKPQNM